MLSWKEIKLAVFRLISELQMSDSMSQHKVMDVLKRVLSDPTITTTQFRALHL